MNKATEEKKLFKNLTKDIDVVRFVSKSYSRF